MESGWLRSLNIRNTNPCLDPDPQRNHPTSSRVPVRRVVVQSGPGRVCTQSEITTRLGTRMYLCQVESRLAAGSSFRSLGSESMAMKISRSWLGVFDLMSSFSRNPCWKCSSLYSKSYFFPLLWSVDWRSLFLVLAEIDFLSDSVLLSEMDSCMNRLLLWTWSESG